MISPKDRQHFNIAVFVMLRNDKGEYLLQRRQNTSFMNGYWDFAAGGHLERGETIKECAAREAYEEAGITVRPESLRLVHVMQYDVGDSFYPYTDFMFLCDEFSGEPATNEPDEVVELKWFKPESFPEKCAVAVRLYEQAGFPEEVGFSFVDEDEHEKIVGDKFRAEV